jgi:hypothetical protein
MSMGYIVSPLEETDLHLDLADFLSNFQIEWPDATIRQEVGIALSWMYEYEERPFRLLCALDNTQQAIFLDGASVKEYAKIALWYRKLVPAKYKLFFYDSGFNNSIELTSTTTEQEILANM